MTVSTDCARPTCGHPVEEHVMEEYIVDDGADMFWERVECMKCDCPRYLEP